ncbi:uncharacterized protein LOC122498193 [Leptopilina heterotoma]|uniref:uncharacterized protein LOC122498193 n=1 Tax=Leptopilina heterotoma TaxID=63436 RepID=UPI001CA95EA4|nr:uncharacterized protein LOC122498193 [Leptopilina heterotoma]
MESATMESSSSASECGGLKKRVRKDKWKENKRKISKNPGRGYVSKNENEIDCKIFKQITNCCNNKCCSKLNRQEQKDIFQKFWSLGSKADQDTFLISCVHRENIKTAKPSPKTKNRQHSWKYTVKSAGSDSFICKKFLITLLQITERRMKTIHQYNNKGLLVATETRGKAPNPKKIPDDIWESVEEHWSTLPHKESHYKGQNTKRKYFDNADLTIVKLHSLFLKFHEKKTGTRLDLTYKVYHKFFREKSKYSIRSLRTDVCDF